MPEPVLSDSYQLSWAALSGVGGLTLALLLVAAHRLQGTTLRAAAGWSAAATLLLLVVTACESLERHVQQPLWYLATVVTLAPGIAVFGAKRPQYRAWFFIVLTLLIVLALPAGEAWALGNGRPIELHGFRTVFQMLLLVAGAGNYLPTRFAPAAFVLAVGQGLLLDEFSAWPMLGLDTICRRPFGVGCVLAAPLVAAASYARWRINDDWSDAWQRFHHAYGLIWSVRVAERFNQAMRKRHSSWHLERHGLTAGDHSETTETKSRSDKWHAKRVLRALLMRFVSSKWLPDDSKQSR